MSRIRKGQDILLKAPVFLPRSINLILNYIFKLYIGVIRDASKTLTGFEQNTTSRIRSLYKRNIISESKTW